MFEGVNGSNTTTGYKPGENITLDLETKRLIRTNVNDEKIDFDCDLWHMDNNTKSFLLTYHEGSRGIKDCGVEISVVSQFLWMIKIGLKNVINIF